MGSLHCVDNEMVINNTRSDGLLSVALYGAV